MSGYSIKFMEYGTNKELVDKTMIVIPRIGEYVILSEEITENWKDSFYIVRSVTYTLGGDIVVHIEYMDIDAFEEKNNKIKEKLDELRKKWAKDV